MNFQKYSFEVMCISESLVFVQSYKLISVFMPSLLNEGLRLLLIGDGGSSKVTRFAFRPDFVFVGLLVTIVVPPAL